MVDEKAGRGGARKRRGEAREALWRGRIEEQARGGMTAREFCRREGVSEPSFYQWRRRLAARPQAARGDRRGEEARKATAPSPSAPRPVPGEPRFTRLWIGEPAEARRGLIEIESRGGYLVRVGPGLDRATLIETLSAIEALGEARGRGR